MANYRIKWETIGSEVKIIPEYLQRKFEKYFLGEYIRDEYLTEDTIALNDFLSGLSQQELNILLKLRSGFAKGKELENKLFTEVLLYCIERAGATTQRPLLYAIFYIIKNHAPSREVVIQNKAIIEKIANCQNQSIKGIAYSILQNLSEKFIMDRRTQYSLKKNQKYEYYQQLKSIISRTKNFIHVFDNYASDVIIDYIKNFTDKNLLNNIKIICDNRTKDYRTNVKYSDQLKQAVQIFSPQYKSINLEVKSSTEAHARFIIIDDEVWLTDASVKDAGNGFTFLIQIKDETAQETIDFFNTAWVSGVSIL